jgi:CHAT domain-containing protein
LYQRSIAIRAKALGPEHPDLAETLNNLAQLYVLQKRYTEAEPLYRRSLGILEKSYGAEHSKVGTAVNNLAQFYVFQKRYAEAEPLLKRGLSIKQKTMGLNHPDVVMTLNNLAALYYAEGRYSQARALYEQARHIALAIRNINQGLQENVLQGMLRDEPPALYQYTSLLTAVALNPKLDPTLQPSAAAALAFEVSEQAWTSAAQIAMARAALRATALDPNSAELARGVQDLGRTRIILSQQLDSEYAKPDVNPKSVGRLQQSLKKTDDELAKASEQLDKSIPNYRELGAPAPITLGETQKLLRADEVLVKYFVLNDRLMIWVVTPNGGVFNQTVVQWQNLAALIQRVRASLERDKPFDVADSYQLYNLLLQPIERNLAGTGQLIIVPDALLPTPFAALVTSAKDSSYSVLAQAYNDRLAPSASDLEQNYPRIAWLANKSRAISVLPSATSLRALRGLAKPQSTQIAQTEPFIGIGDPILDGKGEERGGSMLAAGGSWSIDAIRKLPRLPGTREELIAEANALHANANKALFLGDRATKPEVMRLNQERLGRTRVVSFATHALIGGTVQARIEPALVLTPPAKPDKYDDGLLSLDDIIGLKLIRNNWVILSACNTAAPDGSGEGLSGLARAFFYAGAPSLLVSQWSVDDNATQQLITNVLETYASKPGILRAEALRLGMRKLMNEQARDTHAYFAHPYAWAPFFIVGEGGPALN